MRTYRNSSNQGNSPYKENNYLKSETVPDQSYTVREILDKFASGTLPDIYGEPEYSEDLPDLRGYDISQIHEMKQTNRRHIHDLENPEPPEPPTPPTPEPPKDPE